jgi:putative cell wall-binding protein
VRRLTLLVAAVLVLVSSDVGAATMRRLAGTDRYATAAVVALDRWDAGGPSDVVLAGGADPADALAGAYVSGLHSSPVLLSQRDELPAATLDALRTLAPTRVHVLGGTASISDDVAGVLRAEGWIVERHAGVDRYATAAAIARSGGEAIVGSWLGEGPTALLANGRIPFDALAAGPLAAGQLFPLLLTEAGSLPGATRSALDDLGIEHVIVLGGVGAVSDAVVVEVVASGRSVRRVAGVERTATAVAIAGLLEELGYVPRVASLVSGVTPADALGAGAWGAPDRPVLLCQSASSCGASTVAWASTHDLDEVVVVGGPAAVSDAAAAMVVTPG